jgi:hypothetical protein
MCHVAIEVTDLLKRKKTISNVNVGKNTVAGLEVFRNNGMKIENI